jgi:hypothetical protein
MSEAKPGYIFQAQHELGNGKQIAIHGNFPVGASVKDMFDEMDKVLEAMELQHTKRLKIPAIKGKLEEQKHALEQAQKDIGQYSLKEQAGKLKGQEESQFRVLEKNISLYKEAIPEGEEFLKGVEKELADKLAA